LAAALLPNILGAPKAARDTARKVAVNDVLTAVESYKSANNKLPGTGGAMECLMALPMGSVAKNIEPLLKNKLSVIKTDKSLDQAIGTGCAKTTPGGIYYSQESSDAASSYYVCVGTENDVAAAAGSTGGYTQGTTPFPVSPGSIAGAGIYCVKN